jgi:hypothetical protein
MKTNVVTSDELNKRLISFKDLLNSINNLDDKKKMLWAEIYENANIDRQNAHANYVMLVNICADHSSEHAVHGRTMASFLERMNKANDQLLRLAELVAKAQEESDKISPDNIYNIIKSKGGSS